MKRIMFTALFLIILSASAFASEEDLRMPVAGMCQGTEAHPQEMRFCKSWQTSLKRSNSIRPCEPSDEACVQVMILATFVENAEELAVSTTVIFRSPYFGGVHPWLMTNMRILKLGNWEHEADDLRNHVLKHTASGLSEVLVAIKYLDQGCNPGLMTRRGNEEGLVLYLSDYDRYRSISADLLR